MLILPLVFHAYTQHWHSKRVSLFVMSTLHLTTLALIVCLVRPSLHQVLYLTATLPMFILPLVFHAYTVQAAQCPEYCHTIPPFLRSESGCNGCKVQTQREPGTLFNCFYMLLYPCSFYICTCIYLSQI